MAVSKPVKGSQNYVWFTGQRLGRGSMGNVVIARHRKKGTKFAAKIYSADCRSMPKDYIQRELDMLTTLPSHTNLVKLIAVEEETYSQDRVVVMELCEGGSLQQILSLPQNYYGLSQQEFWLVFEHTSKALHHLYVNKVVHRDIKPGNILLSITADGRHLYKLTDFGSAVKIDERGFKSLCGTEEYLHPTLHSSAFIRRIPEQLFGHSVDMWSFAVTIYQCATGKLPFYPRKGIRNDKVMMQKLMTDKDAGVISQVENDDETRRAERKLPDTCLYDSGTKGIVTRMLSRIFDLKKPWEEDDFFHKQELLFQEARIHVFSVDMQETLTIFITCNQGLVHVKEELAKETDIWADGQLLFYDDENLDSTLSLSEPFCSSVETQLDSPIVLVADKGYGGGSTERKPPTPKLPVMADQGLVEDAKWSKNVCGNIWYFLSIIQCCLLQQTLFTKAQIYLYSDVVKLCLRTEHLLWKQTDTQDYITKLWGRVSHHIRQSNRQLQSTYVEIEQRTKRLKAEQTALCEEYQRMSDVMDKYQGVLSKKHALPMCGKDRCKETCDMICKEAMDMYEIMEKDKTQELSHNDQEIHKYNKSELKRLHKRARELVMSHCLVKTQEVFEDAKREISRLIEKMISLRKLEKRILSLEKAQSRCADDLLKLLEPPSDNSDMNKNDTSRTHASSQKAGNLPERDTSDKLQSYCQVDCSDFAASSMTQSTLTEDYQFISRPNIDSLQFSGGNIGIVANCDKSTASSAEARSNKSSVVQSDIVVDLSSDVPSQGARPKATIHTQIVTHRPDPQSSKSPKVRPNREDRMREYRLTNIHQEIGNLAKNMSRIKLEAERNNEKLEEMNAS